MVAALPLEGKSPVQQINLVLRGSVVDVLRVLIPTLRPYSNDEAFNVILSSPEMASRCFKAFHEYPEAFEHILRDAHDRPVTNDNDKLSCGRSLAQVVALIVQAVAKRYFRAKFRRAPVRSARPAEHQSTLFDKLVSLVKTGKSRKKVRKINPSDRLFLAMRDYLLFEWQLRLIPHYVGLPVSLVSALGARLLDYREVEEIQWMARTGVPLEIPAGRKPAEKPAPMVKPMAPAPSEMAPPPLTQGPVIALVGGEGIDKQRLTSAVLGRVNPALARRLAQDLGLNAKQLAAALIHAYQLMPAGDYQRFGASAANSHEANRFIAAALTSGFGAKTDPATCKEFARLYTANVRSAV
jgi:hypothetical protein